MRYLSSLKNMPLTYVGKRCLVITNVINLYSNMKRYQNINFHHISEKDGASVPNATVTTRPLQYLS